VLSAPLVFCWRQPFLTPSRTICPPLRRAAWAWCWCTASSATAASGIPGCGAAAKPMCPSWP
jgi:hypothetical protein